MRLLVVGVIPDDPYQIAGAKEERPFFQILDVWLHRAGWPRGYGFEVPFASIYPDFLTDDEGDPRLPTRTEVYEMAPKLDAQLRESNPQVVIPLGTLATWAFIPNIRHFPEKDGGALYNVTRAGYRFAVIPFPHPAEHNQLFQDPRGIESLRKSIETLARTKIRIEED